MVLLLNDKSEVTICMKSVIKGMNPDILIHVYT